MAKIFTTLYYLALMLAVLASVNFVINFKLYIDETIKLFPILDPTDVIHYGSFIVVPALFIRKLTEEIGGLGIPLAIAATLAYILFLSGDFSTLNGLILHPLGVVFAGTHFVQSKTEAPVFWPIFVVMSFLTVYGMTYLHLQRGFSLSATLGEAKEDDEWLARYLLFFSSTKSDIQKIRNTYAKARVSCKPGVVRAVLDKVDVTQPSDLPDTIARGCYEIYQMLVRRDDMNLLTPRQSGRFDDGYTPFPLAVLWYEAQKFKSREEQIARYQILMDIFKRRQQLNAAEVQQLRRAHQQLQKLPRSGVTPQGFSEELSVLNRYLR